MREEDYIFKYLEEDKINEKEEGFHWRSHGRSAYIYFIENSSITPIYVEMPGVDSLDVLVYGETKHIERRYSINDKSYEVIPLEDRFRIQNLLLQWLNSKGLRHDIEIGK